MSLKRSFQAHSHGKPSGLFTILKELEPQTIISSSRFEKLLKNTDVSAVGIKNLILQTSDIDWSATTAYAMGGNLAGIYLNVKGREPQGVVKPGQEYKKLRYEIMEKLKSMRDSNTHDTIFSDIFCREEIYSGESLEQSPDIVFATTNDRYVAQGAQEFMFSANKTMDIPHWPPDSGTHQRDGILIMSGQPFQAGSYLNQAEIIDLTPTILYLMGVPIPADIDGQVLKSAFQPQYLAQHPIQYGMTETEAPPDSAIDFTAEEETALVQRLTDLGYLG